MRKFVVTAAIAALGAALIASPGFGASFDHHFSVISKTTSQHRVGANAFAFKDKLLQPGNQSNRVGRDKGKCRQQTRRSIHCSAVAHLNGEIGGFGDLFVRGDLGRHDHRLNVVGGTGDFNGVGGKMIFHGRGHRLDKLHFDLVR
jgi:hypothetical protein